MCVLLGFLQKTSAIPIMNPLSWFMILNGNCMVIEQIINKGSDIVYLTPGMEVGNGVCESSTFVQLGYILFGCNCIYVSYNNNRLVREKQIMDAYLHR